MVLLTFLVKLVLLLFRVKPSCSWTISMIKGYYVEFTLSSYYYSINKKSHNRCASEMNPNLPGVQKHFSPGSTRNVRLSLNSRHLQRFKGLYFTWTYTQRWWYSDPILFRSRKIELFDSIFNGSMIIQMMMGDDGGTGTGTFESTYHQMFN